MIARLWHGWTAAADAAAYERLLLDDVLPRILRVDGYRGAQLLRRELGDETQFVTLTFFNSLDAVRAFAGEDYERAVVPPEAQRLLVRYDLRSAHCDLRAEAR